MVILTLKLTYDRPVDIRVVCSFLQKLNVHCCYPNLQLIVFTDCGNWKLFSMKGGKNVPF